MDHKMPRQMRPREFAGCDPGPGKAEAGTEREAGSGLGAVDSCAQHPDHDDDRDTGDDQPMSGMTRRCRMTGPGRHRQERRSRPGRRTMGADSHGGAEVSPWDQAACRVAITAAQCAGSAR